MTENRGRERNSGVLAIKKTRTGVPSIKIENKELKADCLSDEYMPLEKLEENSAK